jgi:N-acetyl-anhydromuramyl-L-alanine amidase AmpD
MKSEPYEPIVRTCKFLYGVPLGILYHYTGGVDAVKSMRWANDPTWGNTKSSWHVTIFDRITDDKAGELWVKFANSTLRRWFPVPTIIMADWRWGTWHGNWTNDVTLGVENRNTGHSGWQKLGTDGIERLGKTPLVLILGSKKWEPYTREQIVANVNIGRLLNGWIGGNHTLDPNWILGHQCVWATKLDPGPFFPIHDIRIEIFNDDDLSEAAWLLKFSLAPDTNIEDDAHWSKPFNPPGEPKVQARGI